MRLSLLLCFLAGLAGCGATRGDPARLVATVIVPEASGEADIQLTLTTGHPGGVLVRLDDLKLRCLQPDGTTQTASVHRAASDGDGERFALVPNERSAGRAVVFLSGERSALSLATRITLHGTCMLDGPADPHAFSAPVFFVREIGAQPP